MREGGDGLGWVVWGMWGSCGVWGGVGQGRVGSWWVVWGLGSCGAWVWWAGILVGSPGLGVPGQAHLPRPTPGALAVAVKDLASSVLRGSWRQETPGLGAQPGPGLHGHTVDAGRAAGKAEAQPELRPQGPDGWCQPGRPAGAADPSAPEPRRPERGRGDGRGRGHQSSLPGTRA